MPRSRRRLCLRRRIQAPPIYECPVHYCGDFERYELARCASRTAQRAGARIEGVSNLSIALRTTLQRARPSSMLCEGWRIRPLQAQPALLYAAARERLVRLFLGSSAVEHPTVNRMVAGSNPARGAKFRFVFKYLLASADAARDGARSVSQRRCVWVRPIWPSRIAFKRMCAAVAPPPRRRRQIDLIQNERGGAGLLRS